MSNDEPDRVRRAEAAGPHRVRASSRWFRPGEVIGEYRLSRLLGAGAMAEVWAARTENGTLARPVALKLVLGEYQRDPEYRRMFLDEAMLASSIRHPNVCEVRQLAQDQGLLYMVLELVVGDSLRGLLQGRGKLEPLPYEIAARVIADACAGLHAAHESTDPAGCPLHIVHRDVSPPNILVSINGEVKVSDFGIAKARVQYHTRTRTGDIKGKFAYVAPEQVLGGRVDRRADIHALGCVLYLATLGQRPFGGGAEALGRVVRGEYQGPSALDPAYPTTLQAIVRRALASDPSHRFQTADEMRVALEEWLISDGRLVLCTDVAKVVRAHLDDEQRELVEFLSTMEGSVPERLLVGLSSGGEAPDLEPSRGETALPRPSDAPRSAPSVVGRS